MLKRKYDIPFSGFADLDFINVLASVLLYTENVAINTDGEYACAKLSEGTCNGCGNCRGRLAKLQEDVYFLLDTMCGRSSLRCRFDGIPTEMQKTIGETDADDCGTADNVDFLFGYIGYDYRVVTECAAFTEEICASLESDCPVIARVGGNHGRYRVIVGIDRDTPAEPDYAGTQNLPETGITYADIECLYIISGKSTRRFTEKDGLQRIVRVMESNERSGLWDEYERLMGWYGGMEGCSEKEWAARMHRTAETMWHTFNSHNFAEVFRHRISAELKDGVFDEIQSIVNPTYGYTHDLAWSLIGLNDVIPWGQQHIGITIGYAEMLQLVLGRIHENDKQVLAAVKRTLEKMS